MQNLNKLNTCFKNISNIDAGLGVHAKETLRLTCVGIYNLGAAAAIHG